MASILANNMPEAKLNNFFCRIKSNEIESLLAAELKSFNEADGQVLENESTVDETDRLPERLIVTKLDLICYSFSVFTYIMDVFLDIAVAYMHLRNGKIVAGILILVFVFVPSIIINVIAAIWWIDDESQKNAAEKEFRSNDLKIKSSDKEKTKKDSGESFNFIGQKKSKFNFCIRMIACLFQLGPILYYFEVIRFASRYRQLIKNSQKPKMTEALKYYCQMAEAERDATFLRFLEAFLESIPQLLVQGYLVGQNFWIIFSLSTKIETNELNILMKHVKFQFVSILFSLLSVSWAIVGQHKSLRVTLEDKHNLGYYDSILQLFWRMSTIASRYLCLLMFLMAFLTEFLFFILFHFFISLTHISLLQTIRFASSFSCFDKLLLFINAIIHIFMPFNMNEGSTRVQYCVAYSIEFLENLVISWFYLTNNSFQFPFKLHIAVLSFLLFFIGITLMIIYYAFCHPNVRRLSTLQRQTGITNTSHLSRLITNIVSIVAGNDVN